MKPLIQALTVAAALLLTTARAFGLSEVATPSDSGLPLSSVGWQTVHHEQDVTGTLWVSLTSKSADAVLIHPRADEPVTVSAPWGQQLTGDASHITFYVRGFSSHQWHITHFEGTIVVEAQSLTIQYQASTDETITGNFYDVLSAGELHIEGKHRGRIRTAAGRIVSITGTSTGFDELYGPDHPTRWQFYAPSQGELISEGWARNILFHDVESVYGSRHADEFVLHFDPQRLPASRSASAPFQVDGGGGDDTLNVAAHKHHFALREER